ncbi:MAG TPA: NADH-quinone oxidoreductase subunit G, partial [Rhodospirillales bacterium]|nr:NADH-quinone oxidoreductase subunit G [Rhodospirillales bacterium]
DVMDAVGSNIRVDARGQAVMRILPRINEDVNEEWISDKTRFAYDGLKRQRLDTPFVRRGGKLQPASWDEALAAAAAGFKGLKGRQIAAIAGDMADAESMTALKDLMKAAGSPNIDCRQDGAAIDTSSRAGYIFNTTIAGIERADVCLLIGVNPRLEAPIINARLRKRSRMGGFQAASVGPEVDLTYQVKYLGNDSDLLEAIASGSHGFAKVLKSAERPMLIVGMGALTRSDGGAVLSLARRIAETSGMVGKDWNGFNVLHTAAARVGGLDVGFVPGAGGLDVSGILDSSEVKAVYLLGADEIEMDGLKDAFVVYQGHHGDAGACAADVIFPGAAYTEKNATYVNAEGRAQQTNLAVFPPGEAREDWKIIRALSDVMGKTLPYGALAELRAAMAMGNSVFSAIGKVKTAGWGAFGAGGKLVPGPFQSPIDNFYMTDPISRASVTMAACTDAMAPANTRKTGTDG